MGGTAALSFACCFPSATPARRPWPCPRLPFLDPGKKRKKKSLAIITPPATASPPMRYACYTPTRTPRFAGGTAIDVTAFLFLLYTSREKKTHLKRSSNFCGCSIGDEAQQVGPGINKFSFCRCSRGRRRYCYCC
jgi:hypothetical protein